MARRTYPRSDDHHATTARRVLSLHESRTGVPVALPIPIEMIIELTYELTVLWEDIPEPQAAMILGALRPSDRRIIMNARHSGLYERVIGPERFTLAHELAHWIYDADDPNQMTLDFQQSHAQEFCYSRQSPGLSHDMQLREVNANKLAAHLLLPEHLIRAADLNKVVRDWRATAAAWGVSQQTLRIRLGTLGLLGDTDHGPRLDFQ